MSHHMVSPSRIRRGSLSMGSRQSCSWNSTFAAGTFACRATRLARSRSDATGSGSHCRRPWSAPVPLPNCKRARCSGAAIARGGQALEDFGSVSHHAHTPAAAAAATMDRLMPELLELILNYVPLLRRVRVTSLVCKHWRTIALRSVKKLPCRHPCSAEDHLPFTSLTQLNLRGKLILMEDAHLRCPATVRELKAPVSATEGAPCSLDRVHRIPRLIGITISPGPHSECKRIIKILHRSRKSLQSIRYKAHPWVGEQRLRNDAAGKYINSHHFPALASLAIENAVLTDACTNHAAQLTRLVIHDLSEVPRYGCLRGLHFPRLMELDVRDSLLSNDFVALANLPVLRSLTIRDLTAARLHTLCASVARYRLSLQFADRDLDRPEFYAALASCPNIVCVDIRVPFENLAALLKSLTASRTALTMLTLPRGVALSQLTSFPRLQRLDVHGIACDATLPSLMHLSVVHPYNSYPRLPDLCPPFPRLSSLVTIVDYPLNDYMERKIIKRLQRLGKRGVQKIRLYLALYAQSDKRKGVCERLARGCTTAVVRVTVDDRSSETEESTEFDQ